MKIEWDSDNSADAADWENGIVPCRPPLRIVKDKGATYAVGTAAEGGLFENFGWWVAKVDEDLNPEDCETLLNMVKARYRELS